MNKDRERVSQHTHFPHYHPTMQHIVYSGAGNCAEEELLTLSGKPLDNSTHSVLLGSRTDFVSFSVSYQKFGACCSRKDIESSGSEKG